MSTRFLMIPVVIAAVCWGQTPLREQTVDHTRHAQLRQQVAQIRDDAPAPRSLNWKLSTVALLAAFALDTHSSWGKLEANPLLRGQGNRFDGRSFGIKAGITGGSLLGQYLLLRKAPSVEPVATFANYAVAGTMTGVAIRNYSK